MNQSLMRSIMGSLVLSMRLLGQPGDLDPAFGTDGILVEPVGFDNDFAWAVAIQSDSKIVVAGTTVSSGTQQVAVLRLDPDGTPDRTFGGGDGKVATSVGSGPAVARAVAIQSDSKIVIAGRAQVESSRDFLVLRYLSNGQLDPGFGDSGIVTTPFRGNDDRARAIAIQRDGKIIVAGEADNGSRPEAAIARYHQDGELDLRFNGTGKISTNADGPTYISDVAIQSDDKLILAGDTRNLAGKTHTVLFRHGTTGALDPTFGVNGRVVTPIGSFFSSFRGLCFRDDGKILAAGVFSNGTSDDIAVVRFNTDGSVDTSFGSSGIATNGQLSLVETTEDVAVQPDGKVIVCGSIAQSGTNSDFFVARFLEDGSVDTSFGSGTGIVTTSLGPGLDFAQGLAFQVDGRMVVAGTAHNGTNDDMAVVRLQGDAPLPPDGDGLLDEWEYRYWGTTAGHNDLDDFDGDGYCEIQEQGTGLNPTYPDRGNLPPVAILDGYLTMTVTRQPGVVYEVQSGGSLIPGSAKYFSPSNTWTLINDPVHLRVRDNVFVGDESFRCIRLSIQPAP
jgi:uncharacterized delta-60 repeat protein